MCLAIRYRNYSALTIELCSIGRVRREDLKVCSKGNSLGRSFAPVKPNPNLQSRLQFRKRRIAAIDAVNLADLRNRDLLKEVSPSVLDSYNGEANSHDVPKKILLRWNIAFISAIRNRQAAGAGR